MQLTPLLRLAAGVLLLGVLSPAQGAYVTDRVELPLFEAPSVDAKVLAFVPSGMQVREIGRRNDFAQIVMDNGKKGWLALEHLSEAPVGATREIELGSLNEALNAELNALRAEVQRLKNDLLDSEETRKRQIHAISRGTENKIATLQSELEALRAVRVSAASDAHSNPPDATELTRMRTELAQLRAEPAPQGNGRIPSETLREMERLANESRAAKEKLAQAQSRARSLAAAAAHRPLASITAQTSMLGSVGPWHWTLLGAFTLLMFGIGNLWSDYRARKRDGGFHL